MRPLFLVLFCIFLALDGYSQEIFNKSLPNTGISNFAVSNFSGGIEIKESRNNQIQIKAHLLAGKLPKNTFIDFKQEAESLLVYLKTPCTLEKSKIVFHPENPDKMLYQKSDCESDIELPKIKIIVEIPQAIKLYAFTIMDGDIEVQNLNSFLWLKNINGNIKIAYKEKPSSAASLFSINGDIEVEVPAGTATTASFKSFNGDFYTDLASVSVAPSNFIEESKDNGFKYRVERKQQMVINGGGIQLDFDTFNGDVYLTANQ